MFAAKYTTVSDKFSVYIQFLSDKCWISYIEEEFKSFFILSCQWKAINTIQINLMRKLLNFKLLVQKCCKDEANVSLRPVILNALVCQETDTTSRPFNLQLIC
ncbi:uncharacterized protein isoform X3 [Rhodnius prolixus]|uniref:uncharacterized protein isoform X3 n=1 Tax=Rhodnius prolixus TaxID=13249 RepID=UPI003D18A248